MKKLLVAVVAAAVAASSLVTVAEARNRGFQWHNSGANHGWHRGWRHHGWRHHGWRHGWRGRHYGWRGRGDYWGPGYWGPGWGFWGPTVVIGAPYYDDYCFIRKVRRYDANGNPYIRRVRVCR